MKNIDCYCAASRHGAQILTSFYDEQMKPEGLSISQYFLLSQLKKMGKGNVTQWAEYTGLERSTMVRNLKSLEKQGWLTRAEGSGKTWTLSPSGEEILAKAYPVWEKAQQKVENILGKEDAAELIRIQTRLSAAAAMNKI